MSTPPVRRRPVQSETLPPPASPPTAGRLRRLAVRLAAAVRGAHSASVPF
jgi:hypothetical protein